MAAQEPRLNRQHVLFLSALILAMGVVVFRRFFTGQFLYIYGIDDVGSDTYASYLPYLTHGCRMFTQCAWAPWSFTFGVGTSLFSVGSFILDPFNLVLFPFGERLLPFLLVHVAMLKILAAGLLFHRFVSTFRPTPYAALIGSLCYAFNGYLMLWGQHYWMGTAVVLAPLWLYAFERWFRERRWVLLAVTVGITAAWSFYFLYMLTALLALYALLRFLGEHRGPGTLPALFRFGAATAAIYALGLGLGAITLLPALKVALASPRAGSAAAAAGMKWLIHPLERLSAATRLFGNNLLDTGNAFRGCRNYYEAPILYAGLPALLLMPQWLALVSRRDRTLHALLFIILAALLLVPFGSLVMNAFSAQTYRWTFIVLPMLALAATRAVDVIDREPRRLRLGALVGTLAFLAVLLGWSGWWAGSRWPHEATHIFWLRSGLACGLLLIYAACIWAWRLPRLAVAARFVFALLLVGELTREAWITTNRRNPVPASAIGVSEGYFDGTRNAMDRARALDAGAYRIEKNYWSVFLCDAVMQDYRGTKSYNSLNQPGYLGFLEALKVPFSILNSRNHVLGLSKRPLLQSVLGVKYVLAKDDEPQRGLFTPMLQSGDVTIYSNACRIPLGSVHDTCVSTKSLASLPPRARDRVLLRACVIEGETLPEGCRWLTDAEIETAAASGPAEWRTAAQMLQARALEITEWTDTLLSGHIQMERSGLLVVSIPRDEGWHIDVDGRPAQPLTVNFGFTGIPLPAGEHRVELRYQAPGLKAGAAVSCGSAALLLLACFAQRRGLRATQTSCSR